MQYAPTAHAIRTYGACNTPLQEVPMPATTLDAEEFVRSCAPCLRYLAGQGRARRPASLREIVASAGGPGSVALVAVDVVNGFCKEGALASARVGAIVPPIVDLL